MKLNIDLFKNRLQMQRYSESSIRSYVNCMQQFQQVFKKYEIENITIELIERYRQA
jgi:hypothetical protein